MADDGMTQEQRDPPPTDPKEGISTGSGQKKEPSHTPQETEAIIDVLLKESGAIPTNPILDDTSTL